MPLSLMLTMGFFEKAVIDAAFTVSFFGYCSCGVLNKMSSASVGLSKSGCNCRLDAIFMQSGPAHTWSAPRQKAAAWPLLTHAAKQLFT